MTIAGNDCHIFRVVRRIGILGTNLSPLLPDRHQHAKLS